MAKQPLSRDTKLALLMGAVALVLVSSLATLFLIPEPRRPMALTGPVTASGEALVGGAFELVDHTGRTVTNETFRGRHMLIYFGFTYCPDVCPASLLVMTQALEQLGERAEAITPIFITVDPQRDTPEVLAGFVPYFSDDLIGLTGTPEQVAAAAKAYKVYYNQVEGSGGADYLMDHSSIAYLMGPDGRFLTHFPHPADPDQIAARLRTYL